VASKRRDAGAPKKEFGLSFTEDRYAVIELLDCEFHDFSKARKFVEVFTAARVKAKGRIEK
jgi:hypothetical protein